MKAYSPIKRKFLFLQGPTGPFFWLLSRELVARKYSVSRINFNGGDKADWPGEAINYRGNENGWGRFFDRYVRENKITDILLFGDCRPLHSAAHGLAKLHGISIHVFEEGYIRPHWVTMEPDGVNGHSSLPRDPSTLLREAASLPPLPRPTPITASFRRRMRDALRYYASDFFKRWQYPFYRSHRPGSILGEAIGWLIKFMRKKVNRSTTQRAEDRIRLAEYFLFPLQLNSDYQIRTHSPFATMREATLYVMENFAEHAPEHMNLVIKEHPLDCEYRSWRRFVIKHARRLMIENRIIHIAGGDLNRMTRDSHGIVTVNSTSGTLGLSAGTPVFVMGSAIYDIPGITHQGKLDDFWAAPVPPDMELYDAFRSVLHKRCLVAGGFASQSAIATLIDSTMIRLFEDPAHIPVEIDMGRELFNQAAAEAVASVAPLASSAGA